MSERIRFNFLVLTVLLLSGCLKGGGNSASSPVTSTLSFPLQGAFKSFVANGFSNTFSISGTDLSGSCGGSGSQTVAPATTPATFEGVTGFSAVDTFNMTITNCKTASSADTITSYYDTNYTPLGYNNAGVEYGVYRSQPLIPASVKVGDAGLIGSITLYTDSSKAAGKGRVDVTYAVEADTENTAIVNFISREFDATDTVISTEQDRYRIGATGALIPVSVRLQLYPSSLNLVDTFN
jgi:hypothetical protein